MVIRREVKRSYDVRKYTTCKWQCIKNYIIYAILSKWITSMQRVNSQYDNAIFNIDYKHV